MSVCFLLDFLTIIHVTVTVIMINTILIVSTIVAITAIETVGRSIGTSNVNIINKSINLPSVTGTVGVIEIVIV